MSDLDIMDRIQNLMDQRKISVYRLAILCDLPQSTPNSLFARKNSPSTPTLMKICEGLQVTLGQLTSDDADYAVGLTNDQKALIENYNKMNAQNQQLLRSIIYAILNSQSDDL